MGTVVRKHSSQCLLDRPLRMLPASLFTLLVMADGGKFSLSSPHLTDKLHEAIIDFLKSDNDEALHSKNKLTNTLVGWQGVLQEFCEQNEITDVYSVNQPNLNGFYNLEKDYYVYAAYLPAGYHQLVIYDPM